VETPEGGRKKEKRGGGAGTGEISKFAKKIRKKLPPKVKKVKRRVTHRRHGARKVERGGSKRKREAVKHADVKKTTPGPSDLKT